MLKNVASEKQRHNALDPGRKLNAHKTFKGRPRRLLNVLCTFNLRLASRERILILFYFFLIQLKRIFYVDQRISFIFTTNFENASGGWEGEVTEVKTFKVSNRLLHYFFG